jgi:hypothetical protein
MWKLDDKIKCIRCGEEIEPGLMNQAHHWTECPKNPRIANILITRTPLIVHLKEQIKIKKAK